MRIALYGNIANWMYGLTKLLRKHGHDAYYIHDYKDTYPFSQPVWEDIPFTMDYARLTSHIPNEAEWRQINESHGWKKPDWMIDSLTQASWTKRARRLLRVPSVLRNMPLGLYKLGWRVLSDYRTLADQFSQFDWVIVAGPGVIAARWSGTPYLYWPNGGDIRILPFKNDSSVDRVTAGLMRSAILNATVGGTHDPTMVDCFRRLGATGEVPFLPFITDEGICRPQHDSGADLFPKDVLRRAEGKNKLFLAARQDFYWKGTDRFLKGFIRAAKGGAPLFLVISRWGKNVHEAERMVADAGLQENVHYLDYAVSKPLLLRMYHWADVVVDQFNVSAYGSTMLEAMACARPVMIHLDMPHFLACWPSYQVPPVINVNTEDEIFGALNDIAGGHIDVQRLGADARRWTLTTHGESRLGDYLPRFKQKECA